MKGKIQEHIGIVGAGVTGLFLAYLLKKEGHRVTLFETGEVGGLASCKEFSGIKLERFFHHFFSTDIDLLDLLKEIGLLEKMMWFQSRVGFYHQGKLLPFNKALDILRFSPLALKDRLLLGASFLYFQKKTGYEDLEEITIEEWYEKIGGKKIFNSVWKSLLISKFGKKEYKNIPASWLWGRIHPRIRSRGREGEKLGYLYGGTQILVDALMRILGENIFKKEKAEVISEKANGVCLKTEKGEYIFDRIIVTTPNNVFRSLVSIPQFQEKPWESIQYQGVVCAILESRKPISEYYWLNVIEENFHFGGIIEHTNFVPKEWYGGNHVIYIFQYVPHESELFLWSDEEIRDIFLGDLETMFPNFRRKDITHVSIEKTRYATPIYTRGYSKRMPPQAFTRRIFLANTSQIYPHDRNINNSLVLAKKVLFEVQKSQNKI